MHIQDEETWDEAGGMINVTPLVDVVFQLLLFFMLTTSFQQAELEQLGVDLPQAAAGKAPSGQAVVIEVHKDGGLWLEGQRVDLAQLKRALTERAQRDKDTPVTIRGDAKATHQSVVGVMDACAQAGLTRLAVGTLHEASPAATGG